MNHKMQKLNELKTTYEQLNNEDKISLYQINTKNIYSPPSIYLLGKIAKKTAGVGDGNKSDIYTGQLDAS